MNLQLDHPLRKAQRSAICGDRPLMPIVTEVLLPVAAAPQLFAFLTPAKSRRFGAA
jgi:hypothetical protein